MHIAQNWRKGFELGIGMTAIATLILAGCGGGASNSGGTTTAATTTTSIIPYKGMFTSGSVTLVDANGNPVTLSAGGSINASGVASVTYPSNVAYPLTVNVAGTYLDETSGVGATGTISLGSPLQGLIPSTSEAASGVPVTAVTHMARTMLPASGFSAASAVAAITGAASSVLGISSYSQAMLPPVFDANGKTSDVTTLKLAALANVIGQQGAGADLSAKLHDIANKLAAGSAVNAVIPPAAWDAAVSAVNAAGTGMLPNGVAPQTIPAFVPPSGNLNTLIAGAIPTCSGGQVLQHTATGLQCVGNSTGGGATIPTAPTGVTATAISSTQINLSWAAVSGAQAYFVYRSTTSGQAVTAMTNVTSGSAMVGPSTVATSLNDTYALSAGTTYYYKVVALNGVGASVASAEVSATTTAAGGGISATNPPVLSTNLCATHTPGTGILAGLVYHTFCSAAVVPSFQNLTLTNASPSTTPVGTACSASYDSATGVLTATDGTSTRTIVMAGANTSMVTENTNFPLMRGINPSNTNLDGSYITVVWNASGVLSEITYYGPGNVGSFSCK